METMQRWIDATRDWVDPLYGITAALAVGLLAVWLLNRPATIRDRKIMGGHYKGNITPKTLPKTLQDAPQPAETGDQPPVPRQDDPQDEAPERSAPEPEAGDPLRRLREQRQKAPPRKMR